MERSLDDLRSTGLLWLINRTLLHPRGFALALVYNDAGEFTGWTLMGDGSEPWRYDDSIDEDEAFRAVEALLAETAAGEDG